MVIETATAQDVVIVPRESVRTVKDGGKMVMVVMDSVKENLYLPGHTSYRINRMGLMRRRGLTS